MHRTAPGVLGGGLLLALCGYASVTGCVGDAGNTPIDAGGGDGGKDVSTDDGASDTKSDAVDAAAPACDPNKPFGTPSPLVSINSAAYDYFPWLSPDEKAIYFERYNVLSDGGLDRNLYVATRTDRTAAFAVPVVLQLDRQAAYPVLTPDELVIYFQSGPQGASQIFKASRVNKQDSFGPSASVAVLGADCDSVPGSLAADNSMYLTSCRTGGKYFDIWRAPFAGAFGAAELVAELSTSEQERDPKVSADEKTLVFTSTRPGGKGGFDIWITTRASTASAWGSPVNVSELNTSAADFASWLSPDLCRLYLVSDRPGGFGFADLYVAERGK
jgi:hypothetical protein